MLDDIFSQSRNNFIKGFSGHEEIIDWLREQWAGMFADSLRRRQTDIKLSNLETQVAELANVVSALKSYSEEIIKSTNEQSYKQIIQRVNQEFQDRQRKTFAREDLVSFVKEVKKDAGRPAVSDEQIFDAFIDSNSMDQFFDAIDRPNENDITNNAVAIADFEKMKLLYALPEIS